MADRREWSHMRERARERGLLGKELFVVTTTPTAGLGPLDPVIQDHLAYQRMLEDTGVMFAAGPLGDESASWWEGEGMVVIRADDIEAAREIAAADPMHKAGARSYTVRPWLVNEGTITLKVGFAAGTREVD